MAAAGSVVSGRADAIGGAAVGAGAHGLACPPGDRPASGRWLILADDLTGAGDTAIALAGRHGLADVYLDALPAAWASNGGAPMDAGLASVAAVDLHTRDLPAQEAARRVAATAARVPAGVEIYKKIDSTLRGHIGAELAALCASLPDRDGEPLLCIVAPAFPAMGRTIEDGELRMHGKPVDAASLWGAGAPCAKGGIAVELRAHGFTCLSLGLADIRSGPDAQLARRMAGMVQAGTAGAPRLAVVCDAASEDDMQRIARAAGMLPARRVWVGSAGLAHALADVRGPHPQASFDSAPATTRCGKVAPRALAFVVGSFSAVAAEQVRLLAEGGHAAHVAMPIDELIGDLSAATVGNIEAHLVAARDIVLSIARHDIRPELAQRLSAGMARVAQAILPQVGALVCCGGDTSHALLNRIGARHLRVRRCAEPGATAAWCDVRPDLPIVMKAGAFGDADALIRLHRELSTAPPAAGQLPASHTLA